MEPSGHFAPRECSQVQAFLQTGHHGGDDDVLENNSNDPFDDDDVLDNNSNDPFDDDDDDDDVLENISYNLFDDDDKNVLDNISNELFW